MKAKSLLLTVMIALSVPVVQAETRGYLYRKPGDDVFYVDKKHENGVKALWKGEWTKALAELESCLALHFDYARDKSWYRDSSRSETPTDSMVMYDPRYNAVRYALVVANAHAGAVAIESGNLRDGDSLATRGLYFLQHVKGGNGPEVILAFCHLAHANKSRSRFEVAETVARRAVNAADRGLATEDPTRALAYLRLGEVYLASGKHYEAESPLLIAVEVADSGAARKGDMQQSCREMAVEARCLLAADYERMGQSLVADSLYLVALELTETAKKPLNVPQVDSLFGQFVTSLEPADPERANTIGARLAKERERRDKEFARKDGQ